MNFHPITCYWIVSLQFLATSTKDGMSTQSVIYVAYVTEIYWKNEFLQYTLLVGLNTVLLVTTLLIKIYYTCLVFHIWNSNRSQKAQNNVKAKIHFPANTSSKHHVINYNLSWLCQFKDFSYRNNTVIITVYVNSTSFTSKNQYIVLMKLATLRRKNFHLKIKSFIKKSRVGASAKEKENRTCMNKCSKNFELINRTAPLSFIFRFWWGSPDSHYRQFIT